MIAPDRQLLQQEIYNFLRTLTIKFAPIADRINLALLEKGYAVNFEDQTTWKYYLNMAGRYHASDTLMYVTSLDTRQRILFSPEIFATNPRTRAVFQPGGSYYNRLCETYPEQVDLIKSILFPVTDITNAITAPDLTLLNYGTGYLEENEESVLVMELEQFLRILVERWYFDFLQDEPYFYLTFWGTLPVMLAMCLMSARVANIKTAFVHSWDIWNELVGHGLDNYSDILDRKKSMMLYQNIDYFKTNAGKQSNLLILADRLLSDFGIGLYGRKVVQESETGAANYQLTPQLVPFRLPATTDATTAQIEIKTVSTLQTEIYQKGLTQSDQAETVEVIERKLGDTTLNDFSTKFLEIRPIATNKPYADLLNMFLIETLIVSIKEGYYTQPVELTDPLTNSPLYLSPAELLALYNYAILKSIGITTDLLPTQVNLYYSFLPVIKTPTKTIPFRGSILYLSQQVDVNDFLSNLSYAQNLQNPEEFVDNATALWLRFLTHILADENTKLEKRHVVYDYLSTLCHTRRQESLQLVSGHTTYSEWLGSGGIDIYSSVLSQYDIQSDASTQWNNLADTILTSLIPLNATLKQFGNFTSSDAGYARIRQLFIQMCSYRVVFLESERDTGEYAIGSKWSTDYGPDNFESFTDSISTVRVSTINTIRIMSDQAISPGVDHNQTIESQSHVSYSVTNTTQLTGDHASQIRDSVDLVAATQSSLESQGVFNFRYNPPIITMTEPS